MTLTIVDQILSGQNIVRLAKRSGVEYATIASWKNQKRTPRIDLLIKVANAAGFEIMLHQKQGKPQLIVKDGRINAYYGNVLQGYSENDILYAMDGQGYAVQIGTINHRAEIFGKIDAWRKTNGGASIQRQP